MATILITSREKPEIGYECYWWWEGDPQQGVKQLELDLGCKYPPLVRVVKTLVQQGGGWHTEDYSPVWREGWIACVGSVPTPRRVLVTYSRIVQGEWCVVIKKVALLEAWDMAIQWVLREAGTRQSTRVLDNMRRQNYWPKSVIWVGDSDWERVRAVPFVASPFPRVQMFMR